MFKVGFEGVDINERFRAYRTAIPTMKVCHIVYCPKAFLIEQVVLQRFKNKTVELNHEFISEVSLSDLVSSVETIINFCNLEHQVVALDAIEAYNES